MSSKATKAKRKALSGVSADALIEAGLLDPFFHLRDPVEIAYEKFLRRFPSPEQSEGLTADGAHGAGEMGGE